MWKFVAVNSLNVIEPLESFKVTTSPLVLTVEFLIVTLSVVIITKKITAAIFLATAKIFSAQIYFLTKLPLLIE